MEKSSQGTLDFCRRGDPSKTSVPFCVSYRELRLDFKEAGSTVDSRHWITHHFTHARNAVSQRSSSQGAKKAMVYSCFQTLKVVHGGYLGTLLKQHLIEGELNVFLSC